jgi:hypothetical protein
MAPPLSPLGQVHNDVILTQNKRKFLLSQKILYCFQFYGSNIQTQATKESFHAACTGYKARRLLIRRNFARQGVRAQGR